LILFGEILLLIPGFIADIIALLFPVAPLRHTAVAAMVNRVSASHHNIAVDLPGKSGSKCRDLLAGSARTRATIHSPAPGGKIALSGKIIGRKPIAPCSLISPMLANRRSS
jgi:UPF0716 family protein affecting phage T7 exclusion